MADDTYAPSDRSESGTTGDDALLKEIRERFDYAFSQWEEIRKEADKDVRFVSGDTWDAEDRALRVGRPVLNLDQLGQYVNQLVNSFRQNPRAAKVSPAGDGATEKTANLRADRIREIEYQSHAQEAYTVAGEDAATRSYGFCRIVAEYENSTSANQALRIKAIPNPNQVIPDPDAESTSGADWRYLFFVHTMSVNEFKRDYDDATIKDFSPEHLRLAPRWIKEQRVQIAEYWKVIETPVAQGRPKREVCQYLTNGVEILTPKGRPKKTVWPGSSIPFASCYGKIVYKSDGAGETQKLILSYVRLARDAAKYYNWIKSTEGEVLSMVPKASLAAYEGQLSPENLADLVKSLYTPVPVIFFKAKTEATGDVVLPLPQRNLLEPPIQAYEIAAESARRDVQNALGRYSTQDSRLGSTKVTSGVALRELDKSGDLGSYHFHAHYDDMIREIAVKLDELLPFYDDTPKEVAIRLPDGTPKMQKINEPTERAANGTLTYGPDDLRMDVGRHTITISTGPSFDSQREQAKEAAMALLGNPVAFPTIASDAVRLMDLGPIGDQMAKDLEFIQPPPMQAARAAEQQQNGAPPDPRLLLQENAQLKERIQKAEQLLQVAQQEIATKQAEQQGKAAIVQAELQSKDQQAQAEQALQAEKIQGELEIKRAEVALKEAELDLQRAELEIKRAELAQKADELRVKVTMHHEDIESAELIARLNAEVKVEAAEKAAQVKKSIAFQRGADGAVNSATIAEDNGG